MMNSCQSIAKKTNQLNPVKETDKMKEAQTNMRD